MPIHYNIYRFKLEEEIEIIEKAGNEILFILPETIEEKHICNNIYGAINTFMIIFRKKGNNI